MASTVKWMIFPARITRETYVLVSCSVYVCVLFLFGFGLFSEAYIHDAAENNDIRLSSPKIVCAELVYETS